MVIFADPSCVAGWPIQNRAAKDHNDWTVVSPDQQFSCYGKVTEWHYLGKTANGFRAIVWRPLNGSDILYEIVGINDIPAGPINTPVTHIVSQNEQIAVVPGDMIGWSCGPGVIAYNGGGDKMIRKTKGNLLASLGVGQVHDLSQLALHREYSIAATVRRKGIFLLIFLCYLTHFTCVSMILEYQSFV